MKALILAVVLLVVMPVRAQEPAPSPSPEQYTVDVPSEAVAIIDANRIKHNVEQCEAAALKDNCTQAQLVAAGSAGALYADSAAGRLAYVSMRFSQVLASARDTDSAVRRYRWALLPVEQRAPACQAASKPDDCGLLGLLR